MTATEIVNQVRKAFENQMLDDEALLRVIESYAEQVAKEQRDDTLKKIFKNDKFRIAYYSQSALVTNKPQ